MANMKVNVPDSRFKSMKMKKFHGHIKIVTSYAKSGNIAEVVEQDNIVTNALADIFDLDYLNGIDANSMFPLYEKWFGGILMYENAFATSGSPAVIDPDNYFPPSDSNNHLYAHAGDVSPSDVADDTRRGSPNTLEKIVSDGYIKLGWEWGSSVGNVPDGHSIRSVALTHKDTGNCGLGSGSNAFASFVPFANISNLSSLAYISGSFEETFVMYDDNRGLSFYVGGLGEYQSAPKAYKTSDKISIYIKRQAFFKTGLVDVISGASDFIKRAFEVTLPFTLYVQPSYWFDKTNKHLWIFTNVTGKAGYKAFYYDKQNIRYCVIDCENEELVNLGTEQEPVYYKTIQADTACLAPTSNQDEVNDDGEFPNLGHVIGDGTTFYFPIGTGTSGAYGFQLSATGLLKINILNNNQTKYERSSGTTPYMLVGCKGGDIITGNGFVVNDAFYPCGSILGTDLQTMSYAFNSIDKVSNMVYPVASANSYSRPRAILANKLVHTTMLNLDTPVQKTNAKNMNVTYELTEASENE